MLQKNQLSNIQPNRFGTIRKISCLNKEPKRRTEIVPKSKQRAHALIPFVEIKENFDAHSLQVQLTIVGFCEIDLGE